MTGSWLGKQRLVWASPEMVSAVPESLRAATTGVAGKWQTQDPATLARDYPEIRTLVNDSDALFQDPPAGKRGQTNFLKDGRCGGVMRDAKKPVSEG